MTDELASLTRRQLEELREKIDRELQQCVIDQREGAAAYRVSSRGATASIMLCRPCFEKFRLPETRVQSED